MMNTEIEKLLTFKVKDELNNSYVKIELLKDYIKVYIRRKSIKDVSDSIILEYNNAYILANYKDDILLDNLSYIANIILYDYKKYITSIFFKGER